jgi:hypothetical protein
MRAAEPLPEFDPYEALGVEPWADAPTILAAWRAGISHSHPDLRRADDRAHATATAEAARLNVARDWLLDPARRSRYDQARWPRGERVEVPDIDPLGAWPARKPRPRPPASFVPVIAMLALMGWLVALLLDPVANPSSAGALFALSTTILVAYGGWSLGRLFLRR